MTPDVGQDVLLASQLLRDGKLVVVPTETVYGLAALALDSDAVSNIFEAKGRPANNPLIVHVSGKEMAKSVVTEWPTIADELVEAFWPGPLTLVLPKARGVPDITTAGGDTVAVRCPDHPLFLALIEQVNEPIAAPSANFSTRLSPTRVKDLDPVLLTKCAYVLDGGDCAVGIESTVLDLTSDHPTILRQGILTARDLSAVARDVRSSTDATGKSPGQHALHYAPIGKIVIVDSLRSDQIGIGILTGSFEAVRLPNDPKAYAKELFASLAELDRQGVDPIYVEAPPHEGAWAAVWDRLRRASNR